MAFSNVGFAHIIDYINEGVLTGRFTEGERIPSVRDMAELMQVAPNTVVHAYDKLALRGLVYPMRGLGYYISEGAVETIRAESVEPSTKSQSLASVVMQSFSASPAKSFARHSISKPPTPLLSACPAYLSRRDWVCGARRIIEVRSKGYIPFSK